MFLNVPPSPPKIVLPSFEFSGITDKVSQVMVDIVPAIILITSVIILLNFVVNVLRLIRGTVYVSSTDGLSKNEVDSLKRLKRKEELRKELRELSKQDRKK